jgi:hypothetical protein
MAVRKAQASQSKRPPIKKVKEKSSQKASPKQKSLAIKKAETSLEEAPVEQAPMTSKNRSRIQTAEGWKRSQMKKRKLLKTETKS